MDYYKYKYSLCINKVCTQYKIGKAGGRVVNSALGSIGRKIGNEIIKGLFGKK